MATSPRFWELEFEMAVSGHLEDDCELRVHVAGDALNRRRNGYVTLEFSYSYPDPASPTLAQVHIAARELPSCEQSFAVDLRELDKLDLPDLCASLAAQIRDHQGSALPGSQRRGRSRREAD